MISPYVIPGLKFRFDNKKPHEEIIQAVIKYTGVNEWELFSKTRERPIVIARMVCMWCLVKTERYTLTEIGKLFTKHHTNAIHARNTINKLLSVKDPAVYELIEKIKIYI